MGDLIGLDSRASDDRERSYTASERRRTPGPRIKPPIDEDFGEALLEALMRPDPGFELPTHLRVVDRISTVPEVEAVVPWPERFGRRPGGQVYHYALLVVGKPGVSADEVHRRVNEKLHDERLLHRWQLEYLRPGLIIDESVSGPGRDARYPAGDRVVGALLVPRLSASLAPRSTALLPTPARATERPFPQIALVISGPYGGNTAIGGLLSRFVGAGHLRAEDFVRYFQLSDNAPPRATSLAPSENQSVAGPEDAIPVGRGLVRVFNAPYPAAWTISVGTEYLDAYEPLVAEVRSTPNVVVAVRHAKDGTLSWRRMAAWCLGVRSVHSRKSQEERALMRALFTPRRPQWSQTPGGPPTATVELSSADEVALLDEVRESAKWWYAKLEGRSRILDTLLSARAAAERDCALQRPSIEVSLPSFAESRYPWFEQIGNTLQSRTGEVPDSAWDRAVFYEDFDLLVDLWTTVALEVLDRLLRAAGHDVVEGRRLLVERCSDHDDPLRCALVSLGNE